MKTSLLALLFALSLGAQTPTKPNLADTKPPATPPAGTTYALILGPGFGVIAIDPALIDRTTVPATLRLPVSPGGGQLWDDSLPFAGSQAFTTLSGPLGRVYVYKNGVLMTVNSDYTQTVASGLVTVTFLAAQPIATGDRVTLLYLK